MAQVINTNVGSLFAAAALNKSANALQTAQQRLSSGLRINSSKDDATGMASASIYDAKIRGANMNARNANDGISLAQTADGYLGQILENTQRLREIFVQTGAVTNEEAVGLIAENGRIDGLVIASATVVVDSGGGTAGGSGSLFTRAATFANLAAFDTEIAAIVTNRAEFGTDMATLGSAVATLQTESVNLSAAYSRIMDTDYAAETTNMTRNNILQQAGTAVLAQANQTPNTVLTLLR
ncbi:MAG: flagellin [Rhodocyclaceae bacterium]|nr:flagellin [Rhodocyclaceae bacterium]